MKKILIGLLLSVTPFAVVLSQDPDILIEEGIELYEKGDYEGSIIKYDAALQIKPGHEVAMYEKSLSFSRLKRYEEAVDLLVKILDISRNSALRSKAYV